MTPTLDRRSALGLAGLGLAGGGLGWYLTRSAEGAVTVPDRRPEATMEATTAVAADVSEFGLALLESLGDDDPHGNVALSPLSTFVPLAITYEGARGETADGMQTALSASLDRGRLHPALGALMYDLEERAADAGGRSVPQFWESDRFDLGISTALWGQEDFPFREAFLDAVESNYGPAIRTVDFAEDPNAAGDRIENWIETTTQGRIDDALPHGFPDRLTRLAIASVVYLFADWADPFDPDDTSTEPFRNLDGSESTVEMMAQTEEFPTARFGEDDGDLAGVRAVELPYVGETTSMVCLLPPEGRFRVFERHLDGDTLRTVFDELSEGEVRVSLPRFEFDTELRLEETLQSLGMDTAFDPGANFDGIVPHSEYPDLHLQDVFSETKVQVDEEGTEAVSVSVAGIGVESGPLSIRFDRSFIFVIRDRPTDAALFVGRVVDGESF